MTKWSPTFKLMTNHVLQIGHFRVMSTHLIAQSACISQAHLHVFITVSLNMDSLNLTTGSPFKENCSKQITHSGVAEASSSLVTGKLAIIFFLFTFFLATLFLHRILFILLSLKKMGAYMYVRSCLYHFYAFMI